MAHMTFASNEGVDLWYDVEGPPDGETVVFVEGLGYGRWMWRFQRRGLDRHRTVVWDNRGTGNSDVPEGPYSMVSMARDLDTILDEVDVDEAHLVGASMGGMIAMQYALEYDRVASLTLLCTTPGGPESVPVPEETAQQMFDVPDELDEREAIRQKMAPAMSDGFRSTNDSLIEQIVDWRLETDAPEKARVWQAAAVESFDVSDRLDDIDVPTLVVHGTADRVVPFENGELLAEGIPNVEFVAVDGGSHLFFIEDPETVTRHLEEFLDDV